MSVFSNLLGGALVGLAVTGACTESEGGSPIGSCFSPTQSPELSFDAPDAGCACHDEVSRCVMTEHRGGPWDVALVCIEGRWQSVEDGPCEPGARRMDCFVDGQRYADGASVPDPFSCNTCTCEDGTVTACTEIGCADPCPAGTSAGTSCAVCGPLDGCEVAETACLVTCRDDDDCSPAHSFCGSDGLCRNVCG